MLVELTKRKFNDEFRSKEISEQTIFVRIWLLQEQTVTVHSVDLWDLFEIVEFYYYLFDKEKISFQVNLIQTISKFCTPVMFQYSVIFV